MVILTIKNLGNLNFPHFFLVFGFQCLYLVSPFLTLFVLQFHYQKVNFRQVSVLSIETKKYSFTADMYLKSKITSSVLIGYNISLGIHRHVGCWKCSLAQYYIVEYRGLPPTPLFSPPLLLLARKCTIIGTESLIPPC